tara:strand:+ start:207 stop:473 length:267 start_codon:yes stop_codon:yes gene_type:complete
LAKQANSNVIERIGKTDGKANDKTGVPNFNGYQFQFTDATRGVFYLKPDEVLPLLPAKIAKFMKNEPVKVAEYLMGRKITLAMKLDVS